MAASIEIPLRDTDEVSKIKYTHELYLVNLIFRLSSFIRTNCLMEMKFLVYYAKKTPSCPFGLILR